MALGLVGKKIGMTRLFSATGEATLLRYSK